MRYYDEDESTRIQAEQWQLDMLKRNPDYTSWGPHEDYMWNEKGGWDGRKIFRTWTEFGPWALDDLNECVNFYFSVNRESEECGICGGNGYHRDAQGVVNSFYSHMNPKGEHWDDKITEDEATALVAAGRGFKGQRTAEEFNAAQRGGGLGAHDAINRVILTRARLERLGIPVDCDECSGYGRTYTAPSAHVSLTLWWLHPRKGCSRGIEVERIEKNEIPEVLSFLREAAARNAKRFLGIANP